MAFTYSLVASSAVGSGGAASIDFNNIPSNYTDLCLVISARFSNDDVNCLVKLNGSGTLSVYSGKSITGTGSSVASSNYSNQAETYALADSSTFTASTFGNVELYFPNYSGNSNKSWSATEVTENNAATSYARLGAWLWSSTAPIVSIRITGSAGGNFAQYSTAYLYGIRAGEY